MNNSFNCLYDIEIGAFCQQKITLAAVNGESD